MKNKRLKLIQSYLDVVLSTHDCCQLDVFCLGLNELLQGDSIRDQTLSPIIGGHVN